VAEACEPFVTPSAAEAKVSLSKDVPEDLPPVLADPQQLQQVFVNLLLNAVQATPQGGHVRLSATPEDCFMRVSVSDTGCGMDEELRASIFKPFFTTKHIGTGLGLSIVQRIVNAHGGRIEIQSDPQEGSTFTVFLPVAAGSA
jgi:signal transduction histidine kinase